MGVSGKSKEMQFFITDDELKSILTQILNGNVVIIKDKIFKREGAKTIQNVFEIEWPTPLNDPIWWLWDTDLGKLSFEPSSSPVIQLRRCQLKGRTLLAGSIATLISYYNSQNEEIEKPVKFIKWWKEVKKKFKKGLVICVEREDDKEYKSIFWASPGAIELYKGGIEFRQIAGTPFTFHPKI